ncbi:MAG: hypothetical protein GY832_11975, partial [Chloroflexi bacterium]|nr:hypothetical protein [Chloroflexota bacterium]
MSFPPNYTSSSSERPQSSILPHRLLLSDLECYNCHQKGHISRSCPQPRALRRNNPVDSASQTAPAATIGPQATVAETLTATGTTPPSGNVTVLSVQEGGP